MSELIYSVPGMSCEHCRTAIVESVDAVVGVTSVAIDLERKLVTVTGDDVTDVAVRAAIDDAGYEVAS
ncbi:MAG: heavy-metal-associated domain-containing protein [Gaiellaceae bacterium]